MATIINNPPASPTPPASEGGSGMGLIVGLILAVVVIFLFVVYGLPAMRGTSNTTNDNAGPTINVPEKIDINVNK